MRPYAEFRITAHLGTTTTRRRAFPSPRLRGKGQGEGLVHWSTCGSRWIRSVGLLSPTLSSRLCLTHISRPKEVNPKGIPSLSPGLRAASYPGCESSKDSSTLKGLKHPTRPTKARERPAPCCNPFRVERASGTQPRVARGSQPWASGYNPVGIEERLPDLGGIP